MRKKSHVTLANFLVHGLDNETLKNRKKAFYIGNLLPDCKPSFITVRHEYDETIQIVEKKLRRLVELSEQRKVTSMRQVISLGEIFHYLADYFTFPHNTNYPGNLKDHCVYENDLKHGLRSYIREGNAVFYGYSAMKLKSVEEILEYIKKSHEEYMEQHRSVEEDCEYITKVCSQVLAAIANLAYEPAYVYAIS